MRRIAVIGAGMMGTAICWPLHDNGHEVHLIGTPLDVEIIQSIRKNGLHPALNRIVPEGIEAHFDGEIPSVLEDVDLIVIGVSSFGVDWFTDSVGPYLSPGVPVIAVTKGLEVLPDGDFQPETDYIDSRLPQALQGKVSFTTIGGPCIAHELAARRQTGVVFGGKDALTLESLKEIFQTAYYHIWTSTDLKEVSMCAALKNGYALGVGMAVGILDRAGSDGLAQMYNLQAAVFAQSTLEMRTLIKALGGKEEYVLWLPGAGDLYVTVFGGRTRKLGQLIGQGKSAGEALALLSGVTLESVEIITRAASAVTKLEERNLIDSNHFPLLRFLDAVIHRNQPPNFPWEDFFTGWQALETGYGSPTATHPDN